MSETYWTHPRRRDELDPRQGGRRSRRIKEATEIDIETFVSWFMYGSIMDPYGTATRARTTPAASGGSGTATTAPPSRPGTSSARTPK